MKNFVSATVTHVEPQGIGAVCLYLKYKPTQPFVAGQFVTICADVGGESVERSYSIASHPTEEHFRLGIKKVAGGKLSPYLVEQVQVGQQLNILPPVGQFQLRPSLSGHYIFAAAGSGITPILPLIKEALLLESTRSVLLLYTNRSAAETMFMQEVESLCAKDSRFQLQMNFSKERGRLNVDRVAELLNLADADLWQTQIMLCGPQEFMSMVENTFLHYGVEKARIHSESFEVAAVSVDVKNISDPSDAVVVGDGRRLNETEGARVEFILNGQSTVATMNQNQTVLEAAIQAGLNVPFSCMEGVCFACLARLDDGQVFMPDDIALDESEIKVERKLLTCQCRVLSQQIKINFDEV